MCDLKKMKLVFKKGTLNVSTYFVLKELILFREMINLCVSENQIVLKNINIIDFKMILNCIGNEYYQASLTPGQILKIIRIADRHKCHTSQNKWRCSIYSIDVVFQSC